MFSGFEFFFLVGAQKFKTHKKSKLKIAKNLHKNVFLRIWKHMTLFKVAISPWLRPAVGVVAAHGLTDLFHSKWPLVYAVVNGTPPPKQLVTPLFCLFSVIHLSQDLGVRCSAFLHLAIAAIAARYGQEFAFNTFLVYFLVVHVPAHFCRVFVAGKRRAVVFAAFAGLVFGLETSKHETLLITDDLQTIVISHIICVALSQR